MHQARTLYVGMDGQQESLAVAYVGAEHHAEVIDLGAIGTRQCAIDQLIRTMQSKSKPLVLVDAAGPWGSWLYRALPTQGHLCWVVAPSLSPKPAGDRVNTHRRDARPLARLLRAGALTPVDVPQVEDDAIRERRRAREDARRDRKTAKHRLKACRLRHDSRSTGRATWGPAPWRWLREVVCATPAPPIVVQEDGRAVSEHTARLPRREPALHEPVHTWPLQPVVEALQGLRGGQFTVAVTLVAELGDRSRVDTPSQRRRSSASHPRKTPRATIATRGRSPRPATPTRAAP